MTLQKIVTPLIVTVFLSACGVSAGQGLLSLSTAVISRVPIEEKFPVLKLGTQPQRSITDTTNQGSASLDFSLCRKRFAQTVIVNNRIEWLDWCMAGDVTTGERQRLLVAKAMTQLLDRRVDGFSHTISMLSGAVFVTVYGREQDAAATLRALANGAFPAAMKKPNVLYRNPPRNLNMTPSDKGEYQ